MAVDSLQSVDLGSPQFKANPFPFYARLRAENPVYRMTLNRPANDPLWIITRYQEVSSVLKDERFVKNPQNVFPDQKPKADWKPAIFGIMDNNMLKMDAPDHTRLRVLVHKVFTPARVDKIHQRVQQLADELLDKAAKDKHFDLISYYALPIPLTVICEVLGVPVADIPQISRWKQSIMSSVSLSKPVKRISKFASFIAFVSYIRTLCHNRRLHPQDDLISALASADEAGQTLSDEELQGMVVLLLVAGHETAVSLISSGTLALLQFPDQLDLLRQNPSLVRSATEELLRYYPPIETATDRWANQNITIEGVTIPRGGQVRAVIASANRDPAYFDNPESLDITRENNKHLSFGQGVHYCIGAPLARLEGHVAFNTLLARMPNLRLDVPVDSLRWRSGLTFRRLETLPVTF